MIDDLFIPAFAKLLALGPGSKVLDLCGASGRLARRLAPHVGPGGIAMVVDVDAAALSRGRQKASRQGLAAVARFRCESATASGLPAGFADAALLAHCRVPRSGDEQWCRDTAMLFQEMRRLVRRGGRVVYDYPLTRLFVGPQVGVLDGSGGPVGSEEIERLYEIIRGAGMTVLSTHLLTSPPFDKAAARSVARDSVLNYLPCLRPSEDMMDPVLVHLPEGFYFFHIDVVVVAEVL